MSGHGKSTGYKSLRSWEICIIAACDEQTEFTCHSTGRCIPRTLQCDSYSHCEDNSDETSECSKCRYAWDTSASRHLGLCSQSGKASYRQISRSLEASRLNVIMIVTLWNVAWLSNFRAIGQVRISRLRVLARSSGKTSVRFVNRGPVYLRMTQPRKMQVVVQCVLYKFKDITQNRKRNDVG